MTQGRRLEGEETVDALTALRSEEEHIDLAWRQACQYHWLGLLGQVFDALAHFYTLNGAYQEILSHCQSLEETLRAMPQHESVAMLLFHIGVVRMETYHTLSQPEEGLGIGRTMQPYVENSRFTEPALRDLQVRYHLAMAYLSMLASSLMDVKHHIQYGEQSLSETSSTTLHGRYEMLLAYYTSFHDSNIEVGLEHGERALDHYRRSGNRWKEAEMLYEMGTLLASYRRGNEKIAHYLQSSLRIRQQLHDMVGEAETLTVLGKTTHGANYMQRIAYLRASMHIHDELGHEYRKYYTLAALSAEYLALGQYQQVHTWLAPLQTDKEVLRDPTLRHLILGNLSLAASMLGQAEDADTLVEQMYTLHKQVAPNQRTMGYMIMGYVRLAGNRLAEAQTAFEQALRQARRQMNPWREIAPRTGLAAVGHRLTAQGGHLEQKLAPKLATKKTEPIAKALAHVEWLYPRLHTEGHDLYGREFFWPHWVCYQVLHLVDDPRADDLLVQTHQQLLQWADELTDETLRSSFLANVAVNRMIVDEWKVES